MTFHCDTVSEWQSDLLTKPKIILQWKNTKWSNNFSLNKPRKVFKKQCILSLF